MMFVVVLHLMMDGHLMRMSVVDVGRLSVMDMGRMVEMGVRRLSCVVKMIVIIMFILNHLSIVISVMMWHVLYPLFQSFHRDVLYLFFELFDRHVVYLVFDLNIVHMFLFDWDVLYFCFWHPLDVFLVDRDELTPGLLLRFVHVLLWIAHFVLIVIVVVFLTW